MNEEYEIDRRKVALVAGAFLAIIALIVTLLSVSCACNGVNSALNGEWNRQDDATYSKSVLTIHDTDKSGFLFDFKVYNGNLAGSCENLRADFRGKSKTTATFEVKDTDAFIKFEFDKKENTVNIEFCSLNNVEADVIEGFGYGAYVTGVYYHGAVEYMNTSLSQMEVMSEERDTMLKRSLTNEQYARLMNCFQTHETGRDEKVHADIVYGKMTDVDYAAIILFYDDGTYSMIISSDGNNNMSYITNNDLYTADLGAYPDPIQEWLNAYETDYYNKQNAAEAQ